MQNLYTKKTHASNKKDKFILDDKNLDKNYIRSKHHNDYENSAKEVIFDYVKQNYKVPTSFTSKDITFNNIIIKEINDNTYILPMVVEAYINDKNHRRYKIKSALN